MDAFCVTVFLCGLCDLLFKVHFPISVYGCGLRVTEPLELRLKDVDLRELQLVVRGAKGGKDRVVPLPPCLVGEMRAQMSTARAGWKADVAEGVPVALPGALDRKTGNYGKREEWAWVFPAVHPCLHRDGAAARDLQEVLGHTSLTTTMRYLAADVGRVRSPLERLVE